jgi:hypothetical protein
MEEKVGSEKDVGEREKEDEKRMIRG